MNAIAFLLLISAPALLQTPQEAADKAAADLYKKVEERILNSKTLHAVFKLVPTKAGAEQMLEGELMIGENGAFIYRMSMTERPGRKEELLIRSDGRLLVMTLPRPRPDSAAWKPEAVQKCLKKSAASALFMGLFLAMGRSSDPDSVLSQLSPQDVKSGGKERVGAVEAEIVTFGMTLKEEVGPGDLKFSLWIDPSTLAILKRRVDIGGRETVEETATKFEIDPAFPADHFEFQSAGLLAEGRAMQLSRSVALYAKYTGRLPATLEDLKRRPADLPAAIYWPEGGFWIGGEIPKDLPFKRDATHFTVGTLTEPIPPVSPVAAPTDRLKQWYQARIRIQLFAAAAAGYHKAASSLPATPMELLKKPESIRFWPPGGWIAGEALPNDPWGQPYVVKTGASFSATVSKARTRQIPKSTLTPEELKGLDDAALPKLGEKEQADLARLLKQLGADNLADRDGATKAILAMGGGVLPVVNERLLQGDKDPEVLSRLGIIRDNLRAVKPTWELELKSLWSGFSATGTGGPMMSSNERNGAVSLKTITTAQADFRANDRDGNRVADFWVRDVAGLHAINPATGKAIECTPGNVGDPILKLIEPMIAMADATEGRWDYPALGAAEPAPKAGYYFAALKNYEEGGLTQPYHKGSGRHEDHFGFVAYPAEYGVTGRMTYIVNQDNTIWQADLAGEEIDTFPGDPEAAGWKKMD